MKWDNLFIPRSQFMLDIGDLPVNLQLNVKCVCTSILSRIFHLSSMNINLQSNSATKILKKMATQFSWGITGSWGRRHQCLWDRNSKHIYYESNIGPNNKDGQVVIHCCKLNYVSNHYLWITNRITLIYRHCHIVINSVGLDYRWKWVTRDVSQTIISLMYTN